MYAESAQIVRIYVLIDPINNEIRYVGKTKQQLHRRLVSGHLTEARSSTHKRARWIAKLLRRGYRPRIELVQEVPAEFWQVAEVYWIAYYRMLGCDLVNGTDGGDGCNEPTPEVRAKMSAAKKGKIPIWLVGTHHSDETKAKISKSQSGKKTSLETRAKQSAAHLGQKRTPEQRANMGKAWLGKKHTDESRAKMTGPRGHNKTCRNGHVRTPENTQIEGSSFRCLDCRRAQKQIKI